MSSLTVIDEAEPVSPGKMSALEATMPNLEPITVRERCISYGWVEPWMHPLTERERRIFKTRTPPNETEHR